MINSISASLSCAQQKEELSTLNQDLYRKIIENSSAIKSDEFPVLNQNVSALGEFSRSFDQKNAVYATCIIVLGSKPLDETTPTVDLVYRICKAIALLKSYPDACLVMTGGPTLPGITEAQMMGVIAWSRGVDTRRILLEDKSFSTLENARFCADIFNGQTLKKVFLITRSTHLKRAIDTFRNYAIFKDIQAVDCGVSIQELSLQMEEYLRLHDDPVVRERLERLKAAR